MDLCSTLVIENLKRLVHMHALAAFKHSTPDISPPYKVKGMYDHYQEWSRRKQEGRATLPNVQKIPQ